MNTVAEQKIDERNRIHNLRVEQINKYVMQIILSNSNSWLNDKLNQCDDANPGFVKFRKDLCCIVENAAEYKERGLEWRCNMWNQIEIITTNTTEECKKLQNMPDGKQRFEGVIFQLENINKLITYVQILNGDKTGISYQCKSCEPKINEDKNNDFSFEGIMLFLYMIYKYIYDLIGSKMQVVKENYISSKNKIYSFCEPLFPKNGVKL